MWHILSIVLYFSIFKWTYKTYPRISKAFSISVNIFVWMDVPEFSRSKESNVDCTFKISVLWNGIMCLTDPPPLDCWSHGYAHRWPRWRVCPCEKRLQLSKGILSLLMLQLNPKIFKVSYYTYTTSLVVKLFSPPFYCKCIAQLGNNKGTLDK